MFPRDIVSEYAFLRHSRDLLRARGNFIRSWADHELNAVLGEGTPVYNKYFGGCWVTRCMRRSIRQDTERVESILESLAVERGWNEVQCAEARDAVFVPVTKPVVTLQLGAKYEEDSLTRLTAALEREPSFETLHAVTAAKAGASDGILNSVRSILPRLDGIPGPFHFMLHLIDHDFSIYSMKHLKNPSDRVSMLCKAYSGNRTLMRAVSKRAGELQRKLIESRPDGCKVAFQGPIRRVSLEDYRGVLGVQDAEIPTKESSYPVFLIMKKPLDRSHFFLFSC